MVSEHLGGYGVVIVVKEAVSVTCGGISVTSKMSSSILNLLPRWVL